MSRRLDPCETQRFEILQDLCQRDRVHTDYPKCILDPLDLLWTCCKIARLLRDSGLLRLTATLLQQALSELSEWLQLVSCNFSSCNISDTCVSLLFRFLTKRN